MNRELSADKWFSTHDDSVLKLLLNSPDGAPVKVAILDTGVSLRQRLFVAENIKKQFVEVKDFVKQDLFQTSTKAVQFRAEPDTDGHGTQIAYLVHRVAQDAQLYIGRVVEKRKGMDSNMAKNVAAV
jgi:hypothetical protein